MNESFTSWRGSKKSKAQNESLQSSLVISDSEDDIDTSNAINTDKKILIESSDDEDIDSFQNSRSSVGGKGNHRRSGSHSISGADRQSKSNGNSHRFSDIIDQDDDSSSSMEIPISRRKDKKKKMIFDDSVDDVTQQSEELSSQSLAISDASDVDDTSESIAHSNTEDNSSMSEERIGDLTSRSKKSVKDHSTKFKKRIKNFSTSEDDADIENAEDHTSRSHKSVKDFSTRSKEDITDLSSTYEEDYSDAGDVGDLTSRSEKGVKDLSTRSKEGITDLSSTYEEDFDAENVEDLTSKSEEGVKDSSIRSKEDIEDLSSTYEENSGVENVGDLSSSPEETMQLSKDQSRQSTTASVILDTSNADDSFKNTDHSHQENEFRFDQIINSASHSESEENEIVAPLAQERIEVIGENRSKEQNEHYLTVSDGTDIEEVSESKDSIHHMEISSESGAKNDPTFNSSSEDHAVVMSLVKKEVGVGNVDPLVAQKRLFLTCNIEQVQNQLTKSKMLLNTANINMLPDKGEKLRRSIDTQEAKLQQLSKELESLPKLGTPKPIKPFERADAIHPVMPLSWEDLPESTAVKLGRKAQETHEREQALTVDRLEDLHKSLNARPGDDERAPDPNGLKVGLMPHQQHALAWLLWREKQQPHGGILADDMGLGKTLTMISLVMATIAIENTDEESEDSDEPTYKRKTIRPQGGTLVVCPASLLSQWEGEVKRRVRRGMLSVELYHGTNRETVARRLAKNDMVITTYNLIGRDYKNESSPLYKIRWKRVILDEAHIIRNHKSQASEAACKFHANSRWALTGTPIQNKELDLYALLKYLKCSPFDDLRVWKRWVDNKNAAGQARLATVMKTLMLRRTKQELQAKGGLQALPDKNAEEIDIKLDPDEQLVYEKVLVFSRTLFAQFLHQRAEKNHMFQVNAGKFDAPAFLQKPKDTQFTKAQNQLLARHADVKAHEILVLLLRLRQVCCHPALIHAMLDQEDLQGNGIDYDADDNFDLMTGLGGLKLDDDDENIDPNEVGVDKRVVKNLLTVKNPIFDPMRQSSKMRAVLNTIQGILDKGEKMVVVSQWTSMLEVVRTHLKTLNGATYDILSGKVPVKNRQQIIESFNKVGEAPQILLLSLTAGGVGLNLVGGNHLLLLDIHWNPQLEAQAQDRIYRVGQTKSVYIYKFICTDTIEQRIKALQDKKLSMAQGVLTGAGTAGASKLSLDDLKSLFSL